MSVALPLVVAVPLLSAAILAGVGGHLPRRVVSSLAIMASAGTTAVTFIVLVDALPHQTIHWFGGWRPSDGHTLGIAFTADLLDAIMACTVAVIATGALAFTFRYLEGLDHFFFVLMLLFLGGMTGFAVTGDLFNLFVFFELMSTAGYALCGYRIQQPAVLQGTLGFAVLNSIGAFFILMGIALVYAETGALNFAQIGATLSGRSPNGAVTTGFVLIIVGFLTKAGAVPFHFWLSDAYAVASAPVGALLAGVMSDLAMHAVGRVYWRCFSGGLGSHAGAVGNALLAVGLATAVVGAVMCFLQADTKRQLAFLVVGQGGVFLVAIALLNGSGIAASTVYVATDGMLKAAVFLVLGLVVTRVGASDELYLHGRGRSRQHIPLAATLVVAALGIATLPALGPWRSAMMLRHAADDAALGWVPPVLAASTAVVAGTLLRTAGRVFLGWGPERDTVLTSRQPDEPAEGEPERRKTPSASLVVVPLALVLIGLGAGLAPGLVGHALEAGRHFVDLPGYVAETLHDHVPPEPAALPHLTPTGADWLYGVATCSGALLVAALGLWWKRLPPVARRRLAWLAPPVRVLKAVHSGALGDYALWLAGGASVLLIVSATTFR